jgi:hypothetical protein
MSESEALPVGEDRPDEEQRPVDNKSEPEIDEDVSERPGPFDPPSPGEYGDENGGYGEEYESPLDLSQTKNVVIPQFPPDVPVWDWTLCSGWVLVWVIVFIGFVLFYTATVRHGLFCPPSENKTTQARLGTMLAWENENVNPCDDIYGRACGNYNVQFRDSSPMGETQYRVYSKITNKNVVRMSNDENNNTESFELAGFYEGCFDVSLGVDINDHDHLAVYIDPKCTDCVETGVVAVRVENENDAAVVGGRGFEMITAAMNSPRAVSVYWLPPNGSSDVGMADWAYNRTCPSPYEQWEYESGRSNDSLIMRYYDNGEYTMENDNMSDFETLVKSVKTLAIDMIQHGSSLWLEKTSIPMLVKFIENFKIEIGGPKGTDVLHPPCSRSWSLLTCLQQRRQAHMALLAENPVINASNVWPMPRMMVNAEYNPLSDRVFVPWGIAQPPFYNPYYNDMIKLTQLGYVIAHELGHAIVFSPQVQFTQKDRVGIAEMRQCLIGHYTRAGSQRSERTVQENWADYFGYGTILRYTRRFTQDIQQVGYILMAQVYCSAGTPYIFPTSSMDPHSSPELRVNASFSMFSSFYSTFGCYVVPPC